MDKECLDLRVENGDVAGQNEVGQTSFCGSQNTVGAGQVETGLCTG